jgi:Rhs element Vgr protein
MVVSPEANACGQISVKLSANGESAPATHPILAVDVWLEVNKVARARVVIADVGREHTFFPISVSSSYVPGAKIVIELGYDNLTTEVFSGVIITHGLSVGPDEVAQLVIEAADPAMALTIGRHTKIFTDCTDSELMDRLIRGHNLRSDVSATSETHPSLVQFACSDWDWLVMRAQVNGMVVTNSAGQVRVAAPNTHAEADLQLVYGQSIRQAQLTLDATNQLEPAVLTSVAWDPSSQSLARGATPRVEVQELGNLSSQALAKVFNVKDAPQQTAASLTAAELSTWSAAELLRLRLAKVRGQVHCVGTVSPRPAGMVSLAGFGDRFDGKAFVSAVRHHVTPGVWNTEVEIGLDPVPFAEAMSRISPPGAAGQLAAATQLQVGVVDKLREDPDGQMRVPIRFPLDPSQQKPLWARLASPYATANAGLQFWPEQGDEVIVAFMENDPRFPVVLGSLHSKQKAAPTPLTTENSRKCIVSKKGLRIAFEEDQKAIEISTPANYIIRLDEDAKKLSITCPNHNAITLSEAGIRLESSSDITLTAQGSISLDATTNLILKAASEVTLKGATVEIDAESTFVAKGNAEAKLTSAASVVVQGSLVRIN